MTTSMPLTITDRDGRRRLEAEATRHDLRLTLSALDETAPPQSWLLSRLCQVSRSRPWQLQLQIFNRVKADESNGELIAEAQSQEMVTTIGFTFDRGRLQADVCWRCAGQHVLTDIGLAFALELHHDASTERITMPHLLYNGNPSSAPNRLVPRFGKEAGDLLICEQTRFPIPCVNVEWLDHERPVYLSLFSIPNNSQDDPSLGVIRTADGLTALGTSGLVAFNGQKDHIYGRQRGAMPLEAGYLTLQPGEQHHKTYVIDLGTADQVGWGFREIVRSGYDIFKPRNKPLLSIDRVIELKVNALNNRWHENEHACGYLCSLPDSISKRPPYFLFGWTGQGLRLAWCSAFYGLKTADTAMTERARRAVDFFISGGATPTPGLRYNYYQLEQRRWAGPAVLLDENDDQSETRQYLSSRAIGEAATNLGKVIRLFRDANLRVPPAWVQHLRDTSDFILRPTSQLAEGICPHLWQPSGTPLRDQLTAAGVPCVSALLEAYEVTGEKHYLDGAHRMLAEYWRICGDRFDRPFCHATLDARCEDVEAGLYFFFAAYRLHCLTEDAQVAVWARVAADWIFTFLYFWDTGFREGTICDREGFNTIGWPGVSVQNHHLDVYFPAFELFDFGRRTGQPMYEHLGRTVFDAWAHGICTKPGHWQLSVPGEQGEIFYHTNYFQSGEGPDQWRGGHNPWNPSWIIALVLEAALKFKYDN